MSDIDPKLLKWSEDVSNVVSDEINILSDSSEVRSIYLHKIFNQLMAALIFSGLPLIDKDFPELLIMAANIIEIINEQAKKDNER